jgi:hypothetical protein
LTAPNPTRQKAALNSLNGLFADAANVWIIHSSCESFYDRPEGRSPRITSIALRKLDSAQTVSFSIHQVAERGHIPFEQSNSTRMNLKRKCSPHFSHIWVITVA